MKGNMNILRREMGDVKKSKLNSSGTSKHKNKWYRKNILYGIKTNYMPQKKKKSVKLETEQKKICNENQTG